MCIRKVFPHEVRNILSFRRHHSVGPDGKALYPLPAEGQAENLPRALGGKAHDDSEEAHSTRSSPPTKFWDEGWYFWTGRGREAFLQKMEKMMLDLPNQQQLDHIRDGRKELWHDYQQQIRQNPHHPAPAPWWAPIVAPKSISDAKYVTIQFFISLGYLTSL